MDRLGFEKFHIPGRGVGGSFCLKAIQAAPDRVASAVLQNPIGRHPDHPNYFSDSHAEWSRDYRAARPELDAEGLARFGRNTWKHDFVFGVDRGFVRACPVPTFLLPGTDIPHPAATSAELVVFLPGVEVLAGWRIPKHLAEQEAHVVAFLSRHTPRL